MQACNTRCLHRDSCLFLARLGLATLTWRWSTHSHQQVVIFERWLIAIARLMSDDDKQSADNSCCSKTTHSNYNCGNSVWLIWWKLHGSVLCVNHFSVGVCGSQKWRAAVDTCVSTAVKQFTTATTTTTTTRLVRAWVLCPKCSPLEKIVDAFCRSSKKTNYCDRH